MRAIIRPFLRDGLKKAGLVAATAGLAGSAGAFFLWSLDAVTRLRWGQPWLLWLLPGLGGAVALLYIKLGGRAEAGTSLLLEEIDEPGQGVPARMAPLILLGTLGTHLGGGSAGREGTALQMGGSLGGMVARHFAVAPEGRAGLLMAGMAAGFGAVFGTPWAGAAFALEVLRRRRGHWGEGPWCLGAALLADWVCQAWGGRHGSWPHPSGFPEGNLQAWGKVLVAGWAFGLAARGFVAASQGLQLALRRVVPRSPWRPVLGGLAVIGLVYMSGSRDYLGLGTWEGHPGGLHLARFFQEGDVDPWAWAWKAAFTLATVSFGFKGGEVTPLFFIGAALGHSLAGPLGLPGEWLGPMGMVAVFGAAARTPWSCALMGLELFGPGLLAPLALACAAANSFKGRGLYAAPRSAAAKPLSEAARPRRSQRSLGRGAPGA